MPGAVLSEQRGAESEFREAHEAGDDYVFENFSIKAYMVSKS